MTTTVIDTPEGIAFVQLCVRKAALSLELKGLHRSSGRRTAYSICKSEYGLRGSRVKVLAQLQAMVDAILEAKGATANQP